jgi:hypothetical protein
LRENIRKKGGKATARYPLATLLLWTPDLMVRVNSSAKHSPARVARQADLIDQSERAHNDRLSLHPLPGLSGNVLLIVGCFP